MRTRPDERDGIHYLSDNAGFNVFTDSTLSEWTVNADGELISHRELFRIGYPAEDHLMKQIMFNPVATPGSDDYGLLYIAHGDGTLGDFFGNGQNDDGLGKILRIDPLANGDQPYSIPASNPFTNDDSWDTDEVFAMGFRNPHHIAFAQDGTIMVADVGRANIEEVNVIEPGSNYGWPDREGTFTHLKEQGGGFLTGIAPLPADDAANGFTYPAAQYGHIGSYGTSFTGHSIAGGFVVENGSEWDGEYLYGDFVSFGDVYHSSLQGLQDAVTSGVPDSLTQADTFRARVQFDHDNDPTTSAQSFDTMLDVINNSPRYFSHSGSRRADIRFGQGPGGEIYIMNKRNNTVYLVTNSVAEGTSIGSGTIPTATTPTAANQAPTTPGNLRIDVYSKTSAELFWQRSTDDGFVQGYEITRNGESLGVRDALSLFQRDLDPTETYNYEVTALDFDGNRSEPATITLPNSEGNNEPVASTPDTSSPDTTEPSAGTRPTPPVNVRHQVYSKSSAELFWEPATDDGFVRGYEIVRNGESLGIRDALSLFQNQLDPTLTYNFELTALDFDGNRSDTVTITVATGENSAPPANESNNAEEPADSSSGSNDGNGPTAPGNLRHRVYSKTSAEIFWERASDNVLVQGYEVIRNGESLGVRDSLSFYQNDLDASQSYTFEVTSIDNEGNRSATVTTTLSTGDGSSSGNNNNADNSDTSTTSPPASNNANGPTSPANLRHLVYSKTAAEIFWNRSSDNVLVQGYEIIRNGESLGVRDSLSVFQNELSPTETYTFEVTAIDNEGNRSTTATITLSTSGTEPIGSNSNMGSNSSNSPAAPSGLQAEVYSATAAEVFWDRPDTIGLSYEIRRDGNLVSQTNAVSFFDGSLRNKTTYQYQVVTIDMLGNRSDARSITLTTR